MTLPSLDTLVAYSTFCFAIAGALMAAVWLSLIIWTFRDIRARTRDPFAQILATLVVAILPLVGLLVYLILRPRETLAEAYERALEEEALLQEIEEKAVCPGCSRTINDNWLLCPHCHTRLHKACPDCNSLMELQWNLCPFCGNQQIDPYHVGPDVVLADEIMTENPPIHDTHAQVNDTIETSGSINEETTIEDAVQIEEEGEIIEGGSAESMKSVQEGTTGELEETIENGSSTEIIETLQDETIDAADEMADHSISNENEETDVDNGPDEDQE